LDAIKGLNYSKGRRTDVSGALRLARTEIFRSPLDTETHRNIAVIFTAGIPTYYTMMEEELEELQNVTIIPIGIAPNVNDTNLQRLSAPPHQVIIPLMPLGS